MKVVLSRDAQRDLESISDYISTDNPRRARSFVRELLAKARGIGEMPRRFPALENRLNVEIRHRVHGRYSIFYRIDVRRVYVIRILHAARDHEDLLNPDH